MSLSWAPRLAESQVPLRAALLLLGLWAVPAPVHCSPGHPSWRYSSSEVVIPRKELHRGKGVQVPGWLSYSLRFGGQRHVIHMRRRKLFSPGHLPLMTQDDQGALQTDYPFIPSDCYYLGYLEEIPLSMVTLDTCCGGLEGIMKLDDLTYEIKPLTYSERFEHIVSQLVADASETRPAYRPGHKEDRQPLPPEVDVSVTPRIASRVLAYYPGYITGAGEFSHAMYQVYNNITLCINFLLQISSMMDSFYRGLFISFHLIAVLIFDVENPTRMDDYRIPDGAYARYHRTFQRFTGARTSFMYDRDGPNLTQFEPRIFSMCSGARSLIFIGYLGRHILSLAIHTTRAIGRQYGLYYDEDTCICLRRSTCIMGTYPAFTDSFSNCSIIHMQVLTGRPGVGGCTLAQPPMYFNKTLLRERCGNSEVDASEDCDCGSFKQCYNDPCCKYNCMFEEGADCHKADCCTNCTWSKKGTLCRPVTNICDLPEYCIGTASICGDDLYMQDGTPCSEEGFCYNGSCTDPNVHCRELFGSGAFQGHDACYTINKGRSRFGHCNYLLHILHFNPCSDRDIKCGRLQCSNVTRLPPMPEQSSFHQSRMSGAWCWGTAVHITHAKTIDVGHVRNGTLCAPGKICYRRRCNTDLTSIQYDCPPKKCNFRGVCNNYGECFCHIGWRPPTCILRGPGGSIMSGPQSSGQIGSIKTSQEPIHYLRVVFGRLYAFIAAILFGVATNVKSIQTSTVEEVTVSVD